MKNFYTTFLTLSVVLILSHLSFAQESRNYCSKRDAFSNHQMRSPNLNLQQIADAKKYDIHFYSLDIEMDNLTTDIAGTGEIHGIANEILDSVLFELYSTFNISEIRLNNVATPFNRNGSVVKVPVNLTNNQPFKIAIDYSGTAPSSSSTPFGGSGMSNDSSPSWGNQVTWSLSEPFSAYEWFPCKQDLRDKADSVSMKITVPNNCKAGSNGLLENVIDLGNGTSRYEWFHRHPIAYYLISVAVAEYVEYNVYANPVNSTNPILIQNYIYDNPVTLMNFQSDIEETVDFMELFAELYGKYPFDDEKYGHCMAPLSGGMEHQTMTTQGFFEKGLTAHELGHQWWGNSVTCASWSDIWVNEGFATYSSHLMLEYLHPNEAIPNMLDIHTNVMSNPGGSIWVTDSLNEGAIFSGRLSYDKGAAFVHTLRFMMNDDSLFFQALRNFQTDFKDSVAIGLDVRDEFNSISIVNFNNAFNEWYFGEGYPTYSLKYNIVNDDLLFEISHTTSSSTPTFTNPLELEIQRNGLPDTTVRVDISSNSNHFTIPNFGSSLQTFVIDPNNWIVNKTGSITEDVNYLSIDEESKSVDLRIFPNPSNGQFNVEMDDHSEKFIKVFTSQGKTVYEGSFNSAVKLDLQSKKSGYYIVKISDKNGHQWVKTIVLN
ncbi:M1 family aminopeptidase [Brumimicrobium mesophilum]|uniref:M1 family aminopeptidase n=1 Tax=Brumimicrobium mesophilum TaxID=392717 RepID=UPI000D144539|nr:M1 family aminopeptidase [Brumimicrobium mesophilum]